MLTNAIIAAMLVGAPAEPQKRVTARSVMERVAKVGADATLRELFDTPSWVSILDGIAGGGDGWLGVAAALKPASDAHSSEASFGENATKAKVRAFIDQQLRAAQSVQSTSLRATRNQCLARLTQSHQEVEKADLP